MSLREINQATSSRLGVSESFISIRDVVNVMFLSMSCLKSHVLHAMDIKDKGHPPVAENCGP